jgi:hypothetical protein
LTFPALRGVRAGTEAMTRERRMDVEFEGEIRRADPALRRRAILLVVAGAAAGALAILALERYRMRLTDWLLADPQALEGRLIGAFVVVALAVVAPLVVFGISCWRLGARVRLTGSFPPPGHRVLRDTVVVDGSRARVRGAGLRILAVVIWGSAALTSVLLWRLARLLIANLA